MPLTEIDRDIIDQFSIEFPGTKDRPIKFQNPPLVISDGRTANWREEQETISTEPIAIFMGSDSRKFEIEITYIVGWLGWGVRDVTEELRKFRNYFFTGITTTDDNARADMMLAAHGEKEKMSFRVHDLIIKHSKAYVKDGEDVFPLRSDVSIQAKTWTKVLGKDGSPKQDVDGLKDNLTGLWV